MQLTINSSLNYGNLRIPLDSGVTIDFSPTEWGTVYAELAEASRRYPALGMLVNAYREAVERDDDARQAACFPDDFSNLPLVIAGPMCDVPDYSPRINVNA